MAVWLVYVSLRTETRKTFMMEQVYNLPLNRPPSTPTNRLTIFDVRLTCTYIKTNAQQRIYPTFEVESD